MAAQPASIEPMRPLPFVGLAVDVALCAFAAAIGWHPVEAYLEAHRADLYGLVSLLHALVVPLVAALALVGPQADHIEQYTAEAMIAPPALAAMWAFGWAVPGLLGWNLVAKPSGALFLAVVGSHLLTMGAPLAVFYAAPDLIYRTGPPLRRALASSLGRASMSIVFAIYLFAIEATLFLALAPVTATSDALKLTRMVIPAAFVSYLPVRLALFIATSAGRSERYSLLLSFAHLIVRLALAAYT